MEMTVTMMSRTEKENLTGEAAEALVAHDPVSIKQSASYSDLLVILDLLRKTKEGIQLT